MNSQGMNWISQKKRLAIYLRDGLCCCYCGKGVEDYSTVLTLDHLKPRSKGGSNHETNLATSCHSCNSQRQDKPLSTFLKGDAEKLNHVKNCRRRKLDLRLAGKLIQKRGSCKKALENFS